jgi:hypothetical protein
MDLCHENHPKSIVLVGLCKIVQRRILIELPAATLKDSLILKFGNLFLLCNCIFKFFRHLDFTMTISKSDCAKCS